MWNEVVMSSVMAPNVSGVEAPGRRTVYSMCGMCAVRCPLEVTVEDGRVTWLQGNPHDVALGTSLCAKGSAGLAFEFDDQRPQSPLIRSGPRGGGRWRRVSWDEALDYIADKLHETIETFGGRGIALSDRSGPFIDLTRTFLGALGSPNYFSHDASCGGNVHNAARSIYGFGHEGLIFDLAHTKHLVLYGRNLLESLMVKEAKAFMAAVANGMHCTYIDPRATITACKSTRYWQVRPNSDYALNLAIIHEILEREAYDKAFVERYVSGMDYLREAVRDTTPEWQEVHTGVPAGELRAFVDEVVADAPQVIFHPGWMSARHKQSFYVSRSALILNALMGNIEIPGGCVLGKPPEFYGRTGRAPPDRPGPARRRGPRRRGRHHPAAVGPGHRDDPPAVRGDGDRGAVRYRRLLRLPPRPAHRHARSRGDQTGAGQAEAAGVHRRALLGDRLVRRCHPARIDLSGAGQHSLPDERPGAGGRHARPGHRPPLRQSPGVVDLPRDPGPDGYQGSAGLRDDRGDLELPARRHRSDHGGATPGRDGGARRRPPRLIPRDELRFPTPSGKIEIDSAVLKEAGLPSLAPYQPKTAPTGDRFTLLFAKTATLAHGQSLNNPILNEIAPEQVLWIHPDRAAPLGIADGDEVEVNGGGRYSGRMKANVTKWIHPDAVFMLHGYGATVPLATRALGLGVADQRLQHDKLYDFDPAGGGNALTETVVQVTRATGGTTP